MGDGKVDIVVTEEDFQHYWRRAKERTSFSYSGIHFSHYKAAAHSDYLSKIHALKLSLITESGNSPERWARGLSVMLEKITGVVLVKNICYHPPSLLGNQSSKKRRKGRDSDTILANNDPNR